MKPLEVLKEQYPWPEKKPEGSEDLQGWFGKKHEEVLRPLIEDAQIILELGTWLGKSARFFCENSHATVICVDHWLGDINHRKPSSPVYEKTKNLYEKFISTNWSYRDRIIPMRENTTTGLKKLSEMGVVPDLVYIDADHRKSSFHTDLLQCINYFPEAKITGDDYTWKDESKNQPVKEVLEEIEETHNIEHNHTKNVWVLK